MEFSVESGWGNENGCHRDRRESCKASGRNLRLYAVARVDSPIDDLCYWHNQRPGCRGGFVHSTGDNMEKSGSMCESRSELDPVQRWPFRYPPFVRPHQSVRKKAGTRSGTLRLMGSTREAQSGHWRL